MGSRLTILWGEDVGPCPGIASIPPLLWWLRVSRGPVVGDKGYLVILRGCKWTGELIASFSGFLIRTWLGVRLVLGGHGVRISVPECGRDGFPVSCG